MERVERRAAAMGSTVHVVVCASQHASRLADLAMLRIRMLEDGWSRFRDSSELSRLNRNAGRDTRASSDLIRLVGTMIDAARWTDGVVDASVLDAVVAAGYDRDFAAVAAGSARARSGALTVSEVLPRCGMRGVVVDPRAETIRLPSGVGVDPGAIGKGLAADIVVEEIASAGAHAVLVCVGGDVVARGEPAGGWRVEVLDDRGQPPASLGTATLQSSGGAIATSSTLKRRWRHGHHIIDPKSGLPVASDVAQATVLAPTGWQAEAAATAAIVLGAERAMAWLGQQGVAALLLPHEPEATAWRVGTVLDG